MFIKERMNRMDGSNEVKNESYRGHIKKLNKNDNMKIYDIPLFRIAHTRKEWRKNFSKIGDQEKIMLLESIKQNGLLHPIIVWEMDKEDVDGHTFEILAGNNRFDMYQYLHKSDENNEYATIPALCYRHNEIDENQALEIFVDTNYVQRKLKKTEIAYSLKTKLKILKERKTPNALSKAAEELNIARTWAYTYSKCTELIDEFKRLLDEDKITLKIASKLGNWSANTQKQIYNLFGGDEIKSHLPEKVWNYVPAKTSDESAIHTIKNALNKYNQVREKDKKSVDNPKENSLLDDYSLEVDQNSGVVTLMFNKRQFYKIKKLIKKEDYDKYDDIVK